MTGDWPVISMCVNLHIKYNMEFMLSFPFVVIENQRAENRFRELKKGIQIQNEQIWFFIIHYQHASECKHIIECAPAHIRMAETIENGMEWKNNPND